MNKARAKDQFLYALLAVVFAAVAVVFVWKWADETRPVVTEGKWVEISRMQTPDELMRELQKTLDGGIEADMESLRQEASGL